MAKKTTKPELEKPYLSDAEAESIAIKQRENEENERMANQTASGDNPDLNPDGTPRESLELEQLRAELHAATQAFEACVMERDSALKAEEAALLERDSARQERDKAYDMCNVARHGIEAAADLFTSLTSSLVATNRVPQGWTQSVKHWKQGYDELMGHVRKEKPAPVAIANEKPSGMVHASVPAFARSFMPGGR